MTTAEAAEFLGKRERKFRAMLKKHGIAGYGVETVTKEQIIAYLDKRLGEFRTVK